MKSIILLLLSLSLIYTIPSYATTFSLDKSLYEQGDDIILSGTVNPVELGQFISVQILNPPKSDFAQIDTFAPNADGSFSKVYKADGPKWNLEGSYTLKLFYNAENFETTFEFSFIEPEPTSESEPMPEPEPTSEPEYSPTPEPESISEPEPMSESELEEAIVKQEPKTHVPGFPALDKSPQYYIDRYDSESSYKDWFDSQFPSKEIDSIVGYDKTHITGFPDLAKSPQYYIDRYDSESSYKDWFDSQFPGKTIYQILGFPDPIAVPDWIKNNAQWWSTGKINDSDFVSGIEFMIENNIIVIPNLPDSQISEDDVVPSWVRNNANWWALDQISEDEFVNAIKYLIEKGIIVV